MAHRAAKLDNDALVDISRATVALAASRDGGGQGPVMTSFTDDNSLS